MTREITFGRNGIKESNPRKRVAFLPRLKTSHETILCFLAIRFLIVQRKNANAEDGPNETEMGIGFRHRHVRLSSSKMNQPIRIDEMTKAERQSVQRELIRLGYLAPFRSDGQPSDDGIWGPRTDAAYGEYINATTNYSTLIVKPSVAKPWWLTRRAIGAVIALAGLAAQGFGYAIDADQTTDLVMQGIELGGEIVTYVGALIAMIGAWNAKAPIDPTLVAPNVRIAVPSRRVRSDELSPKDSAEYRDPRGHFHD